MNLFALSPRATEHLPITYDNDNDIVIVIVL